MKHLAKNVPNSILHTLKPKPLQAIYLELGDKSKIQNIYLSNKIGDGELLCLMTMLAKCMQI